MHPYDIVEAIKELTEEEQDLFYSLLPEEEIGRIIAYMEPEEAADVMMILNLKFKYYECLRP